MPRSASRSPTRERLFQQRNLTAVVSAVLDHAVQQVRRRIFEPRDRRGDRRLVEMTNILRERAVAVAQTLQHDGPVGVSRGRHRRPVLERQRIADPFATKPSPRDLGPRDNMKNDLPDRVRICDWAHHSLVHNIDTLEHLVEGPRSVPHRAGNGALDVVCQPCRRAIHGTFWVK